MPFRFRSALRFRDTVGKVDAVVSFTELAIRLLRKQYLSEADGREFLRRVSSELGVYVTHVSLELLATRTSQLHTVSMVQHFETFLVELKREHPAHVTWPAKSDEEPLLDYVLKNITGQDCGWDSTTELELDLLAYYRLGRNRFLHASDDKPTKAKDLKKRAKTHPSFGNLNAPNIYTELSFDDCVVCARCSLLIAMKMCEWGRPSDEQIAEMLFQLEQDGQLSLKSLRKVLDTRERCRKKVQNLLSSTYGMAASDSEGVVDYVIRRLLA